MLPGTTVTVPNEETGFSRATVTNAAGVYSLPELPVGTLLTYPLQLDGRFELLVAGYFLDELFCCWRVELQPFPIPQVFGINTMG